MEQCSEHVRKVNIFPDGTIEIRIASCGVCEECREFQANVDQKRIVRLSNEIKMNLNSDMEIYSSKVTMNTVMR